MKIAVLNGPNLNMLGVREPAVYGTLTLNDILRNTAQRAEQHGVELVSFQSNHDGQMIDYIHQLLGNTDGIIINPGAWTHYNYAIRDALSTVAIPLIEVHLSNIHRREAFREHSVIASIAIGQIAGLGAIGYELAVEALVHHIKEERREV